MLHIASVAVPFSMVLLLVSGCAGYEAMTKERPITGQRISDPTGAIFVDNGGSGDIPVVLTYRQACGLSSFYI